MCLRGCQSSQLKKNNAKNCERKKQVGRKCANSFNKSIRHRRHHKCQSAESCAEIKRGQRPVHQIAFQKDCYVSSARKNQNSKQSKNSKCSCVECQGSQPPSATDLFCRHRQTGQNTRQATLKIPNQQKAKPH